MNQDSKLFYRVANTETNQGLWYDRDGKFTGLIHNEFKFCTNSSLLMPYDQEIVGWLSATDELANLWAWFTKEDIQQLQEYGYFITIYECTDYKMHKNHWVIDQKTSNFYNRFIITKNGLVVNMFTGDLV